MPQLEKIHCEYNYLTKFTFGENVAVNCKVNNFESVPDFRRIKGLRGIHDAIADRNQYEELYFLVMHELTLAVRDFKSGNGNHLPVRRYWQG